MSASDFEAVIDIPSDHRLHLDLPDEIPPGRAQIAIIHEAGPRALSEGDRIKQLLASMPDVGEDADFERPRGRGRMVAEWNS